MRLLRKIEDDKGAEPLAVWAKGATSELWLVANTMVVPC
jgi:hypothetical protein